jgi:hypothetical protein
MMDVDRRQSQTIREDEEKGVDEKGPLRFSPWNAEFSSEKLVSALTSNLYLV